MHASTHPIRLLLIVIAAAWAAPLGCAEPQYVSDTDVKDIDENAMSLHLDRRDLNRLYKDNIDKILNSRISDTWERQASAGDPAVVAIFPIRNETSEHISNGLDALLSKFETDLVNQSAADVLSHENQADLIADIKRQQSDAIDPTRLAPYGRQVGAQYFVTGKVYDNAERVDEERRVQYFMSIQVIDVETGIIKFQNESKITKGLMK